jgi:DNA primase
MHGHETAERRTTAMAWIHQDTIDAVNNNVRISDVFTWLGERVTANNRMAWCPFCHDKTSSHPGCSIDNENGLYHCFVCHRGGNMFSFVREHEGCSFPEAVEMIANQFGIEVKYDESHGSVEDESRKKHLSAILERANEIFIAQRGQREFKEFVERRHLAEDAVEKFEIGFSAARFAAAAISRLQERFSDDDIVASGIAYRRSDGRIILHMQDRITIPTRSISGRLVAFGGRDVTGRSPAKYKNSPETELFRKGSVLYGMSLARREIARRKYAILCE